MPAEPRLDRQHLDAVGIADNWTAGLGLPHVVEDGNLVSEHLVLEPLPGGRVEHFACGEDAGQRRHIDCLGGLGARAHQQPDGRR